MGGMCAAAAVAVAAGVSSLCSDVFTRINPRSRASKLVSHISAWVSIAAEPGKVG